MEPQEVECRIHPATAGLALVRDGFIIHVDGEHEIVLRDNDVLTFARGVDAIVLDGLLSDLLGGVLLARVCHLQQIFLG